MQDFKQLQAWQRAHALSIMLHGLARGFTRAGHASLRAQLTRAADSIAANIVEGCGSSTRKEFARFLEIAVKSASETEHHLLLARDLRLLPPADWQRLTAETIAIRKMTHTYRKKILETVATPS
jgi:four helix bundle protein